MSDIMELVDEIKVDKIDDEESNPNQSFFMDKFDGNKEQNNEVEDLHKLRSSEFMGKSSNRKLEEKYDIHFTIDSKIFSNLITFLSSIRSEKIVFEFGNKAVKIIVMDQGKTHGSVVTFSTIEFSDYTVEGLKDDNDKKMIVINSSIIVDETIINEEKPIDFYVDTIEKNKFYVINGKEKNGRQLESVDTSNKQESILDSHKGFEGTVQKLTTQKEYLDLYQKIIVNSIPLSSAIKSLLKKIRKYEVKGSGSGSGSIFDDKCSLYLTKYDLDFKVCSETKDCSLMLSEDDIIIYPTKEDRFDFNLNYFNKFGKLKLNKSIEMYVYKELPIILSSELGGGGIRIQYLIAPMIDNENEK